MTVALHFIYTWNWWNDIRLNFIGGCRSRSSGGSREIELESSAGY